MARSLAAGSAIELGTRDVHVWRVRLSTVDAESSWNVLSADERERASRFHYREHRDAWVAAHGMLRLILAGYADLPASALRFVTAAFGKPSLAETLDVRFNLSHSGDIALVAVARGREVGVDVEQWKGDIEHLELADHVFSAAERAALRALPAAGRTEGFFAAWSRKEAYLKARGDGIAHGLDHFDVTLAPTLAARLIEDRSDVAALERWVMHALDAGHGYSAALVATAPVEDVLLCDAE